MTFLAFLAKDFIRERRSGEIFLGSFAFGCVVLLILALGVETKAGAGALWIALLFSSQIGLLRGVEAERTGGRLDAILASPVDPAVFFAAKSLSNFLFITVSTFIFLGPYMIIFNVDPSNMLRALPVLLIGLLGIAMTGNLVAFIAFSSRLRHVLMPILFLTLFLPLMLAAISATTAAIEQSDRSVAMSVLIGFDLLMGGASILLVPFLLEE